MKTNKLNKLINASSWNNSGPTFILEKYTKNVCRKITAGICALRRIKPFVDKETLISVYSAIVRPHFDYWCEVWDVLGETQSKRLQKLQNRAARVIMNMSNDIDSSIALSALGWEPLNLMRKIGTRKHTCG